MYLYSFTLQTSKNIILDLAGKLLTAPIFTKNIFLLQKC